MSLKNRAAVADLYRVPEHGKAEIVNGEVVLMSPTGARPGRAGGKIYASLDQYERQTRSGYAFPDNVGFRVELPNRESFSPDAAFFTGKLSGMQFLEGPPILAVEVRSEGDYGPQAEQEMAAKRRDYFSAGTQVVWDVDLLSEVVRVYRANEHEQPALYRRGQVAEAEPAVPGWRMPVDEIFA